MNYLDTLVKKLTNLKCKDLLVRSQLYSITYMLVLLPVAHHLVVLITSFLGIGKWESFSIVVFQDCLGYFGSLEFPYEVQDKLASFCKEASGDFHRDCVKFVAQSCSNAILKIEMKFIYHTTNHLNVYNLVVFSAFALLCNHQLSLFENFPSTLQKHTTPLSEHS